MALHQGIDTVAVVSIGVWSKTYNASGIKFRCNLFASTGLIEDAPSTLPPVVESIREKILNAIDARFKTIVTPETFDSIRQQIIDIIDSRFKIILVTGGYKVNLGNHVFEWRTTPLQEAELPGLIYRDRTDQKTEGCGIHEVTMPIEIEICARTTQEIRECIAELEKAIFIDKTWGGLAIHTKFDTTEMNVEQKEKYFSATRIVMTVTYLTVIGNPYAQG